VHTCCRGTLAAYECWTENNALISCLEHCGQVHHLWGTMQHLEGSHEHHSTPASA